MHEQWLKIGDIFYQLGDAFFALANQPPTDGPPIEPEKPPVEPPGKPRLGSWVESIKLSFKPLHVRPDRPQSVDGVVYVLKDLFTTRDGSWEPSDKPGGIDGWAREAYLKPLGHPDYFDDAGADHHLFAAVIGLDGKLVKDQKFVYWSDGFEKLGDPSYRGYVYPTAKARSGWANLVMSRDAGYVPERGESGPWCWAPVGAAQVVCGGGMPANWHVSMFAVWQAVKVNR